MIPTFEDRVIAWSSPPVDDIGYIDSKKLLLLRADDLLDLVRQMEETRYMGWRNWENRWREVFELDTTTEKVVLDYGCGVGIEALQYARMGNDVVLADISRSNMRLAMRVLDLEGFQAGGFRITEDMPVNCLFGKFDVVHCVGVLHHIPQPVPVVEALAKQMNPGGELRLMVYSDEAWRIATGTEPPSVVVSDPHFEQYWTHWDPIGGYADWYDVARLGVRFGHLFDVRRAEYLTQDGAYLGAILVKR